MSNVNSAELLKQVANAIPPECRDNIVIIGSLAAAYAYFHEKEEMLVQTKDIDCLLKPHKLAPAKAQIIVRQLLDTGWQRKLIGEHIFPGKAETPNEELPAVRLYPPGINIDDKNAWFIELLT